MKARKGNPGSNPEAGVDADTMEEYCLLAYSPWLSLFAFLYNPEHLPGVSPPTIG